MVVTAGLEDETQELISGYITHVRPVFGAGLDECRLEIWGMDASVLMDREDKLKDWPNKKDSDIATEIFGAYGLTPQVEDTEHRSRRAGVDDHPARDRHPVPQAAGPAQRL